MLCFKTTKSNAIKLARFIQEELNIYFYNTEILFCNIKDVDHNDTTATQKESINDFAVLHEELSLIKRIFQFKNDKKPALNPKIVHYFSQISEEEEINLSFFFRPKDPNDKLSNSDTNIAIEHSGFFRHLFKKYLNSFDDNNTFSEDKKNVLAMLYTCLNYRESGYREIRNLQLLKIIENDSTKVTQKLLFLSILNDQKLLFNDIADHLYFFKSNESTQAFFNHIVNIHEYLDEYLISQDIDKINKKSFSAGLDFINILSKTCANLTSFESPISKKLKHLNPEDYFFRLSLNYLHPTLHGFKLINRPLNSLLDDFHPHYNKNLIFVNYLNNYQNSIKKLLRFYRQNINLLSPKEIQSFEKSSSILNFMDSLCSDFYFKKDENSKNYHFSEELTHSSSLENTITIHKNSDQSYFIEISANSLKIRNLFMNPFEFAYFSKNLLQLMCNDLENDNLNKTKFIKRVIDVDYLSPIDKEPILKINLSKSDSVLDIEPIITFISTFQKISNNIFIDHTCTFLNVNLPFLNNLESCNPADYRQFIAVFNHDFLDSNRNAPIIREGLLSLKLSTEETPISRANKNRQKI